MTNPLTTQSECRWVGKRVRWRTPGHRYIGHGNYSDERKGLCLACVPPHVPLRNGQDCFIHDDLKNAASSQIQAGNGWGESVNSRVLVRVDREGAKGQPLKPHYYAARLSSVLGEVSDVAI